MCQADARIEYWDELECAMAVFGEQLKLLKATTRYWWADCGENPELFFNQMADVLKEGEGASPRLLASNWGAVPIMPDEVMDMAANGLLNKCASVRSWFCVKRRTMCLIAYRDLGQRHYMDWFVRMGFDTEASNGTTLSATKIADIVETALALQVVTEHGFDLSSMGDTEIFANW